MREILSRSVDIQDVLLRLADIMGKRLVELSSIELLVISGKRCHHFK